MKVVPRIWCPEQTVVGSLGAEFAPLAAGRVTEPTDHIGVNSLVAESNSKSTRITRSQSFGRGVDFAESIFLLARPAESIFRDVKREKGRSDSACGACGRWAVLHAPCAASSSRKDSTGDGVCVLRGVARAQCAIMLLLLATPQSGQLRKKKYSRL